VIAPSDLRYWDIAKSHDIFHFKLLAIGNCGKKYCAFCRGLLDLWKGRDEWREVLSRANVIMPLLHSSTAVILKIHPRCPLIHPEEGQGQNPTHII
jgi:hypothetical protein